MELGGPVLTLLMKDRTNDNRGKEIIRELVRLQKEHPTDVPSRIKFYERNLELRKELENRLTFSVLRRILKDQSDAIEKRLKKLRLERVTV